MKDAVQPRKHNRYKLRGPMIFPWQDAIDAPRKAVGLTHEISLTGAFILTTSPPPLGANVRLKGFLPVVPHAVRALHLHGQGTVSRVKLPHEGEPKGGFEVEGKPFVLRGGERYP